MSYPRIAWLGLIAALLLAPTTRAQVPTVPATPVGATAPTAAPANLWSFICPNGQQKAALRNCLCNSPIGQLVSGFGGPMAAMSGGLLPNLCMKNSLMNDLQKAADSPEGAAARIKADEADAKARRAAVRFLATVDCARWPEATATLKNALRKDRNECVRFEAALALRSGCCCNNEIIDALQNCVLGEAKTDPNPVERSDRVRAAAADALSRCVMVQQPMVVPPEQMQKVERTPADPEEYYKKLATIPREKMVANARATLVSMQKPVKGQPTGSEATPANATGETGVVVTGNPIAQHPSSLSGIFANAFTTGGDPHARAPFFSGLTKSLTGKQDQGTPISREPALMPAPPVTTGDVGPREVAPTPPETKQAVPQDFPAIRTIPAAPRMLPPPEIPPAKSIEIRQSAPPPARPIEIRQFAPPPPPAPVAPTVPPVPLRNISHLGAPLASRSVEIIQPAPRTASTGIPGFVVFESAPTLLPPR